MDVPLTNPTEGVHEALVVQQKPGVALTPEFVSDTVTTAEAEMLPHIRFAGLKLIVGNV